MVTPKARGFGVTTGFWCASAAERLDTVGDTARVTSEAPTDEQPFTPGRPRRRLVTALWTAAIGGVALTAWRWWGGEPHWFFVVVMPYTPYIAVAALVPIAVAIWLRHWRTLAIMAACVVALAVLVLPRAFPSGPAAPKGPSLNVMTANAMVGEADTAGIVSLVKDNDVEFLAVQELTPGAAKALAKAGLGDLLPHRVEHPDDLASGAGIYSRYPLAEAPDLAVEGIFWMPAARVKVPGAGTVEFVGIHIAAPASMERIPHWRNELGSISADPGTATVLAGDFNSTLDHSRFRDVLDSGYLDAAATTGDGLAGTWQQIKAPLPLALDHVLTDGGAVATKVQVHAISGSDHKALVVEVALPGV